LVARLLNRQLDGAGELVDFPQQASRCAASGWEVHVGRSQSVDSAGAYLARETTPCLALQRRRETGEWRMSHRWQPRYSAPRGGRVCLWLSGTGGARHVVSLRASELSSGSQGPPNRPLPHEKCHEPPGALRVPGFILIEHGRIGLVMYRPGDGCSARVGTRDETNPRPTRAQEIRQVFAMGLTPGTLFSAPWPWSRRWHASQMRPRSRRHSWRGSMCAVRSVQGGRQGPLTVLGRSHRENGSLPGRK